MKLLDWIERAGKTPEQFAADLGVAANMPRRWHTGDRTPRPDMMRRIFEATGGAVTPNDFYDLPALERRPATGEGARHVAA